MAAAAAITGDRFKEAAKRESRAWNVHSDAFIMSNLRAAHSLGGEQSVHFDYGGLRARHDFHNGRIETSVERVDDGGAHKSGGRQSAGSRLAPPQTRSQEGEADGRDARDRDAVQPEGGAANSGESEAEQQARRDAKVAATQRARRQRHKAAAKQRRETKREVVSKFVTEPYGGEGAPMQKVTAPLWSSKGTDLKMAFTKLHGEMTHRFASSAAEKGLHTVEVQVQFGGVPFSLSVLSGTRARQMSVTERSIDLLMLLSDGLTEGRLTSLQGRWSKRGHDRIDERAMDDDDDE